MQNVLESDPKNGVKMAGYEDTPVSGVAVIGAAQPFVDEAVMERYLDALRDGSKRAPVTAVSKQAVSQPPAAKAKPAVKARPRRQTAGKPCRAAHATALGEMLSKHPTAPSSR